MKKFQDLLNRFNNKDKDFITTLYEKGGEMFRDSAPGRLIKDAVTSDFTKTQRNKLLNTFGVPEHYQQFAKYLTGGTIGNKDITSLPDNVKKDVVRAHYTGTDKDPYHSSFGAYPDRRETIYSPKYKEMKKAAEKEAELTGDSSSYDAIVHGEGAMIPNPKYNPESTLLSTYMTPDRTAYTLGHVQFKPEEDGGFRMTDTYKVDSNVSMGEAPYKPLRGTKADLGEGGQLASRLYDISKFFGLTGDMKYNVKFDPSEF